MECAICKGKTVWFEGEGAAATVYVCPRVSRPEYEHKTDDEINAEITEWRIKMFEIAGIGMN